MSLVNYSDLQSSVAAWLDRDDLNTQIPDFISLAEYKINRQLRSLDMETSVVIPQVDLQYDYALPDRLVRMRNIFVNGTPNMHLQYLTPEQMTGAIDSPMVAYTVVDNLIRLNAPGVTGNDFTVEFFQKYEPLTGGNPTNWITDNAMDLLLYGSLLEAEAYLQTDERLQVWADAYSNTMNMINEQEQQARYSGSALQVRAG
jgi:hypothetical protein